MKTKITLLLGILISFGFVSNEEAKKKEWTLQELVESDKAEVSATCIYKDRKNSSIKIKSNFNYPIKLIIPAGTLLYPENDKQQTLTIPKEQIFAIKKKENKELTLRAYCTERDDSSPSIDKKFKIGISTDKKLQKFFTYLKTSKNLGADNMQESIWCITDNESIGNIHEPKNTDLKKVLSEITGQEIPWQSTKRKITMEPGRRVVTTPQLITGKIEFATDKPIVVKSKIINEAGELIHKFDRPAKIPKTKKVRMKFSLKVKGFEEGKYYVIYFTESGDELVKQEFTV